MASGTWISRINRSKTWPHPNSAAKHGNLNLLTERRPDRVECDVNIHRLDCFMMIDPIETAVRNIVDLLAEGRYVAALHACSSSRLSEADLARTLREYERTPVHAPADWSQFLDVVQAASKSARIWSVTAPLWTQEEGRSDLSLQLTVTDERGALKIELDDLHVL